MNISQIHERLRLELLRRVDRGVLTVTMLARQSGFDQAHISNFLRRKRVLSLQGLDRVLASQMLDIRDLLPDRDRPSERVAPGTASSEAIPLVSHSAAVHEPHIHPAAVIDMVHVPSGVLQQLRPRRAVSRKSWQRFVAVRVTEHDAARMNPVLTAEAIVVLDRHYSSLVRYNPARPNIYSVRVGRSLHLCYADFDADRLILRAHSLAYPVLLSQLGPRETASDHIIGRVCLQISEV